MKALESVKGCRALPIGTPGTLITRIHAPVFLCLIIAAMFTSRPASAADDPVAAAVGSSERPASDVARDGDRRPSEVLRFFQLASGQRVVDLMGGSGYYSEILTRALGPEGKVWIQNNSIVLSRFAEKPLQQRLARPGLDRIERLDSELDDPGLPKNLDLALMVLFYHDTYWQGVDRVAMNRAIFEALKPGGIYGVVDHHAEAGSGARDVKTLHRVDATLVRKEIEAAGFVLEAESDLLSHPEDGRKESVFAEGTRGKTDRFVFRFRKPAK